MGGESLQRGSREEEPGPDLSLLASPAAEGKRGFSLLVVGPPRAALALARAFGAVAVSDFSATAPEEYSDVYAVHATSWDVLRPLIDSARRVLFVPGLPGAEPPPSAIVLTCRKLDVCSWADCLCGGALRI